MKEDKQRKKENKNTLIKLLENEWKQVTKIGGEKKDARWIERVHNC